MQKSISDRIGYQALSLEVGARSRLFSLSSESDQDGHTLQVT